MRCHKTNYKSIEVYVGRQQAGQILMTVSRLPTEPTDYDDIITPIWAY